MSTTTIRLPDDLKARVAAAAERSGTTSHSFILEAIAEKAEQAERQAEFLDAAERRFEDFTRNGKSLAWADVRSYLEARASGRSAAKPAPRKLGR